MPVFFKVFFQKVSGLSGLCQNLRTADLVASVTIGNGFCEKAVEIQKPVQELAVFGNQKKTLTYRCDPSIS